MAARGELWTFPGRVTPVDAFLGRVEGELAGSRLVALGTDRSLVDGSHDVRAFHQRRVLRRGFTVRESLLVRSALGECRLRVDPGGNPSLEKSRALARIVIRI